MVIQNIIEIRHNGMNLIKIKLCLLLKDIFL